MQFELLPPVPAVVVARELRKIPLFRFVSVDELFRFSTIARQVRHGEGTTFQQHGAPAEYIQVLIEGRAALSEGDHQEDAISPPALFGFREVLEGSAYRETATAKETSICLAMASDDFRSTLAENIEMAEGLFQMLLNVRKENDPPSIWKRRISDSPSGDGGMRPIDKALLLQQLPIFTEAGAEEVLELSAIVKEIPLEENEGVFAEGDTASIWIVLSGAMSLESSSESGAEPITVKAGDIVGAEETLINRPMSWRAKVSQKGRALEIERGPLFDALADRMDLLQSLFRSLFQSKNHSKEGIS
jgi:CRP-like cAMP-binding protein